MTSAETLRAAAVVLRERAAQATAGPWELGPILSGFVRTQRDADVDYRAVARTLAHEDAGWVATVHPGLAEPLAAWLENAAKDWGHGPRLDDALAVAVARVILGETP